MNMNEENKTENPESGIQTYDRKKKSHGNFLKIGCASCGFVAVVALCVLSSRYSWFGVKADDEGISYSNGGFLCLVMLVGFGGNLLFPDRRSKPPLLHRQLQPSRQHR